MVNEIGTIDNLRLENQLTELTSLVRQLAVGQHQLNIAARVYGIYTSVEHPIDMCPTLQETKSDQPKSVGAIGGYQYGKQPYQSRPFDNQYLDRVKGHMQLSDLDPYRMYLKDQQQQQQRMPSQGNSPSLEYLLKQLATSNLEFQQTMSSNNMQFQQNMNATIQDLKTEIGQLANTVSHLQSAGSSNLPSQTIPNPRGNANAFTLRSKKELPQPAPQQLPRVAEDVLQGVEVGVPCTIGDCTFANAMLDLGASTNVMPTSIYKSLNFGDLEPTGMTIQLVNRSVVQPLGVLEDVLVQVNELIFPADFYVLDMEDETLGEGIHLNLGATIPYDC
ncbi:hypothetical protein CR513_19169, partial [Mucuna pruriens]